jgi:hypothetical protein
LLVAKVFVQPARNWGRIRRWKLNLLGTILGIIAAAVLIGTADRDGKAAPPRCR